MGDSRPYDRLTPPQRRRVLLRALAEPTLISILLIAAYFWLPMRWLGADTPLIVVLVGVLLVFGGVVAYECLQILRARYPAAQALKALAWAVTLYVLGFSFVYLYVDASWPASFSESLTRLDSLYLTVTTFATVGFGDIVPLSQPARALVTLQILGDLVLVVFGLRLLLALVKRVKRRDPEG